MPMNAGTVYCINHPDREMNRNLQHSVLMSVPEDSHDADSDRGVRLVLYACTLCGYVELYLPDTSRFPRTAPDDRLGKV